MDHHKPYAEREQMDTPTEQRSFRDPAEPRATTAFSAVLIVVGIVFIIAVVLLLVFMG